MPTPFSDSKATVVHIANLHCASCVQSIDRALSALNPPPIRVDTSIILQTVEVYHQSSLSEDVIRSALVSEGFDVADYPPAGPGPATHSKHLENCELCRNEQQQSLEPITGAKRGAPKGKWRVVLSVGGMTCSSCSNTINEAVLDLSGVAEFKISLIDNSATAIVQDESTVQMVRQAIEDVGYEASIVIAEPLTASVPMPSSFKATLSVSGMTCSSCVNTISQAVANISGAIDVMVSLLDNSATVILEREDLVERVRETIEDSGYEASIVSVSPLITASKGNATRDVSLRVTGMFCSRCPEKVMTSLKALPFAVKIAKPVTFEDPILTLSYEPCPPTATVRSIVSAISGVSPQFSVSVYRPPSVEERSRALQRREQRDYLLRLGFSFIIAIPTFIIGIVYMMLVQDGNPTKHYLMTPIWAGNVSRSEWALLFMATPVMFYSAYVFHRRSIKELRALWRRGSTTPVWRRFVRFGSMNLLISLGVSVAYFASVALLALAAIQPPQMEGESVTYFDSVVFLTMFLLAGRYLEAYSKARTADAITALSSLRPQTALLVVNDDSVFISTPSPVDTKGDEDLERGSLEKEALSTAPGSRIETIPIDQLEVGDIVRVLHGSSPPADGTIVPGEHSAFDESSLTGESRLIEKQAGDVVYLGTINKGNVVHVRIDSIDGRTMLDSIVKVVREGQSRRAPMERVVDSITAYFVPVVTLLAILTWVIWLTLGLGGALPPDYLDRDIGGWPVWSLEFAIAVFVIACPCGIGLAAPTALLVGSGLAAKHGILARGGGEAFQDMASADLVVFDKTGTLTEGSSPKVTDFKINEQASESWPNQTILGIAKELESSTSHPLSTAVKEYCEVNGSTKEQASEVTETAGRGLKAAFKDLKCHAIIGNEAWMADHGAILSSNLADAVEGWKQRGESVVLLAISDVTTNIYQPVAGFAIADPLRPEAAGVVAWLKKRSVETWMITGDNPTTAKVVASMVGIPSSNVIAGALPSDKAAKVEWLQHASGRRIVAMVGDGINDAPALTMADVGIAMGSGSDVAVSSASFVVLSANLKGIITLTDLSRVVIRRVKFNFLWAAIYNMAALPIAAGVIYPAGHARLSPVWAALAMALSSVSVVTSSLLLKLYRVPKY